MMNDEFSDEPTETGSDELLSDDNLRLPDSANTLVRLHAIRAWLTRRQVETSMEIGEAALALQAAFQEPPQETRLHRRERQNRTGSVQRVQRAQQALEEAQQRLSTYEEAQALLEECVSHTTSGERVLVEYYLTLEDLMQSSVEAQEPSRQRITALADVQHRVEHVGAPNEE
ncbi:MAG: hypothetical protein NVS2B2_35490 [Ktedonobacteraceae bacterium]